MKVTDMVMIARGDMGVEVGNHHVPTIQKRLIGLCNEEGVPVITATQMLESMTTNSRPTRAEANDVANAIWDGTDAVMLSGESAAGQYPVEAVKMMDNIVEEAEKLPKERPLLRHMDLYSVSASIQVAASIIAEKTKAKWVVSVTQSGNSCLKMSRFRPKVRVLGCTNSKQVMRKMTLYWGISPFYFEENEEDLATLQEQMIDTLKERNLVATGDKVVITHGDGKFFKQGSSNSVRLEIIKEVPNESKKESLKGKSETLQQEIPGGRIILDTSVCASCQNCVQVCPHNIWTVEGENNETRINVETADRCTKDMECVNKCPTGAIEIIDTDL